MSLLSSLSITLSTDFNNQATDVGRLILVKFNNAILASAVYLVYLSHGNDTAWTEK